MTDGIIDELDEARWRRLESRPVEDASIAGGLSAMILLLPTLFFLGFPGFTQAAGLAPLFGLASGALLGALVGLLDIPGRLWVLLRHRDSPLALLLMSQLAALALSGLWTGGSAALAVSPAVLVELSGGFAGASLGLAFFAWFAGLALGAPTVVLHATARSLCVHYGAPPYVPAAAAVMAAVGTLGMMVGGVTTLVMLGAGIDALDKLGVL